jgi:hypothetical protein
VERDRHAQPRLLEQTARRIAAEDPGSSVDDAPSASVGKWVGPRRPTAIAMSSFEYLNAPFTGVDPAAVLSWLRKELTQE